MDKLIIESKTILDERTHIRASKKSRELLDEIARRTGRSQAVVADIMIKFAYERVVIEGEECDEERGADYENDKAFHKLGGAPAYP